MTTDTLDLDDISSLLDATMDDLDDLPPVGVPPSGHYNLTVSFDIQKVNEGTKDEKEIPVAKYIVEAINELKDEEERGEVAVGQNFMEFFYLKKKDGEKNTFGIGTLKERLKPHAERFGTTNIGQLIEQVKQVSITASIKRTVNRKNEDQFIMKMSDIVLL